MSTAPKPSNLRAPSKLLKPSAGLPKPTAASAIKTNDVNRPISPNTSGILTENTDDFIVGNRVWVGGTKPGYIQYIGETQFAPGEWAGVVLDDPAGKNDGSVAGVKYFQCEPGRGVFSRLTKLSRELIPSLMKADGQDGSTDDVSSVKANGSIRSSSPRPSTPLRMTRSSTPSSLVGGESGRLKLGDRVQVTSTSGIKIGTLRFLGTTEFAAGEWVGVELDEATGKNDGSVSGKRYFDCPMKYGLFAPVSKVTKLGSSSARRPTNAAAGSTTTPTRRTGLTPKRTGSHESISTIGSTSSTTRSTKPRLGITSLTTGPKPSRSNTASVTATHTAMQDALKEKEQHIEQLLRERDSVMSEIARATSQRDDVDRELGSLRTEYGRHKEENEQSVSKLREMAELADKQKLELEFQLEEERKKVEDLQFRVEEESILKADLEVMKDADAERLKQLEQLYAAEKARVDLLEQDSNANFQNEEKIAKCMDEIEDLQNKVKEKEKLLHVLEMAKNEEGGRTSQIVDELVKKDAQIIELNSLIKGKEDSEMEQRQQYSQLEEALAEKQKNLQKQEAIIAELNSKLTLSEGSLGEITQQVSTFEITCADLNRKLQASDERCEQISQQKSKLECDISELMKSSGGNSALLSQMNDQLREKEKLAEKLQLELQGSIQEKQILKDVQEQMKGVQQKQLESLTLKHQQECVNWEGKVQNLNGELEKTKEKLTNEFSEKSQNLEIAATNKETEIGELRSRLDVSNRHIESLTSQLKEIQINSGVSAKEIEELRAAMEQKLTEAKNEINNLLKEKIELTTKYGSLEIVKSDLEKRAEYLDREKHEQSSAVCERDKKLAVLNTEVDRLKAEFNNYKTELLRKLAENELDQHTFDNMRNLTEIQQRNIEELQQCLRKTEDERDQLMNESEKCEILLVEKRELETRVISYEKKYEEVQVKENQLLHNFEAEKKTLQKSLESTLISLEQKIKESERHKEEISMLNKDLNSMSAIKVQYEFLAQENGKLLINKEILSSRVKQLEGKLVSSSSNGTSDADSTIQLLLDEKEAAEAQIEFLNSVIVDMQKKNDELQSRIQILEVGDLLNDGSDVNLNALNTPKVAPRLFCDICDRFDVHDTEDCPLQASSVGDSPPPTQYHGPRKQDRPYCDTCEIFGHWTNECDDNETF